MTVPAISGTICVREHVESERSHHVSRYKIILGNLRRWRMESSPHHEEESAVIWCKWVFIRRSRPWKVISSQSATINISNSISIKTWRLIQG
jgi:hypothetical protein